MIATHSDKAIVIGFSPNCWLIPLKTEIPYPLPAWSIGRIFSQKILPRAFGVGSDHAPRCHWILQMPTNSNTRHRRWHPQDFEAPLLVPLGFGFVWVFLFFTCQAKVARFYVRLISSRYARKNVRRDVPERMAEEMCQKEWQKVCQKECQEICKELPCRWAEINLDIDADPDLKLSYEDLRLRAVNDIL